MALVLWPFVLLCALEIVLRATGSYETPIWDSPYVRFSEGHRYFPEWRERVAMPKPKDVYRIFALGGSTTMGAGVDRGFPSLLEEKLNRDESSRRVEVVNGGFFAIGSHRVYEVMREAEAFDPDLFLVYLGHNEFLEDVAVDPVEIAANENWLVKTARRLRVVRCARDLLGLDAAKPGELLADYFSKEPEYPLIRSPEQRDGRLGLLRFNVGRMIDFARAHGAEVVFVPAVANPLCWPGDSKHGPGYERDSEGWESLYARALADFRADRFPEAIPSLEKLHEIDDQYAYTHWLLGEAALFTGDGETGRRELRLANNLDWRGAHSNPDIVDVILETCRERGVTALDLRAEFERPLETEVRRRRLGEPLLMFIDHCHPTQLGHEIIAEKLAGLLSE